jgi:spermidine synthase
VGEAVAPDGTVLTLHEHDGDYVIRVNGVELMSTRRHASEERLAELACLPARHTSGAQVLIGGLGLGFTLRAALRCLASDARVVVAELLPEVVAWNENPSFSLAREPLADARVDVRQVDVARILEDSPGLFDAIMLDVDNGPDPLTTAGNARLYRDEGIAMTIEALRPGGRVAYWSAQGDAAFERSLRRAGLTVRVTKVRAHASGGPWHRMLVAHRAGQP